MFKISKSYKKSFLSKEKYASYQLFFKKQGLEKYAPYITSLIVNNLLDDFLDADNPPPSIDALPEKVRYSLTVYLTLFDNPNTEFLKFLIRRLPNVTRKKLFETWKYDPVESFVYTTILNAANSGKTVSTKTIINYLRKYKNIKIDNRNEFLYKAMIRRVRVRIANKYYRKRLTSM